MRPRRDPKRKPPSEQALREALRKDLLDEAAQERTAPARTRAQAKTRKKRKRPARAVRKDAARPESDGPVAAVPEDGPDAGADPVGPDARSERDAGAPAGTAGPSAGEADGPTGSETPAEPTPDPRVEELEDKVRRLTEALEGMSTDKTELEGVAQKFKGMEDRMKGLLQLSEVLSVRYNPFLSNEEGDVFDGSRHDPSSLLPKDRPAPAPQDGPSNRPREVLRPQPAPLEERFRGEVVRLENDEPEVTSTDEPEPEGSDAGEPYTMEDDLDAELEAALAPFHEEAAQDEDGPGGEGDEADDGGGAEVPQAVEEPEESGPAEDAGDAGASGEAGEPDLPEQEAGPGLEEPREDAGVHGDAVPVPPEPEAEQAPPPPGSEPSAGPAPPAPRVVPRPAAPRSAHRPVAPAPPARPATTAQPGPSPPYHAPGRSRESYLALCWFEQMAREGDPSEIHLFVDHYAGLGWIPPEHHGWMAYLAEAVAPRDPDATWDDVDVPAHERARMHRRNLRFLDKLFRCGLGADDPLRWDDEAQWWMEDG